MSVLVDICIFLFLKGQTIITRRHPYMASALYKIIVVSNAPEISHVILSIVLSMNGRRQDI